MFNVLNSGILSVPFFVAILNSTDSFWLYLAYLLPLKCVSWSDMYVYFFHWCVDKRPTEEDDHAVMYMQFPCFDHSESRHWNRHLCSDNEINVCVESTYQVMHSFSGHGFADNILFFRHLSDWNVEIAFTWWRGHLLRSAIHPHFHHSDNDINMYVRSWN